MKRTPQSISAALVLAVGLCSVVSTARAQGANLSGTISTTEHEPLVGADVKLLEVATEAEVDRDVADRYGRYEFGGLAPGSYELVVRFVGFERYRDPITLTAGTAAVVNVRLDRGNVLMDPIVITASRRPEKAIDAPASLTILSAGELQHDAVTTPLASIRNVPGVDIQQHGINHLYLAVRGFNENYAANAHPLVDYRDMHGPAFSDAHYVLMPIHTLDLARIEIVRGPGSALYGAGVDQGVVHFITKDPFTYPGTSFLFESGQQKIARGAFRHAGVIDGRLGYKLVGSYSRGEDWKFDPKDPHDAQFLDAIAENLVDREGNVVRPLGDRVYDTYSWRVGGEARYRFGDRTVLTGNAAYTSVKNSFNGAGEWQWDAGGSAYAQLRLRSGRFFSQAFYSASLSDEDHFNYRTGLLGLNKSSEIGLQAQYGQGLLNGRQDFTGGVDFQHAVPRSGGSIMGRNENDDTFYSVGAYLQSESHFGEAIDITLSGRLDYFSPTEGVGFSPRGAVLLKLTPEHRVRLTYNRALGLVKGLAYFMDLPLDDLGAFTVRARGAATPFTFADPLSTSSFIALPDFPGQDPGVGMALQRAYIAATAGLTGADGPLAAAPAELQALLWSRVGQISGFSSGALLLNDQIIEAPTALSRIKNPVTNTIEVGYQGLLWNRLFMGLDAYYTKKERFLGSQMITPMVLVPGLGSDLGTAVGLAFTNEELSAYGLDVATLEQMYSGVGSAFAENPVGVVEPVENFDPDTRPELLLPYANFGELDFFGVDLWIEASLGDRVTGFFNTSWVSDDYFDDEELKEPGSGRAVCMNGPKNKLKLGLAYAEPGGFNAHGSLRYVRSFDVLDDFPIYVGTVDAYTLLDLGFGYDLSSQTPGLRLDVTAMNVLNNRHREYIGVPTVGRLVTGRVTYAF